MLGRQHLTLTGAEWRVIAARTLRPLDPGLIDGLEMGGYAEPFLKWLGYERIESMDFSEYEGCSLTHDLNVPVPEDWHGRYDVVFDGGTLEHVFHFPNAIANAMKLVRTGGVFVGCSPSNNYNGHGFYQFSPELFCRIFEAANGFRTRLLALVESTGALGIYRVTDPKRVGHRVTFGGKGPLQMVLIAEKVQNREPLQASPSQSDYAATWEDASSGTENASPTLERRPKTKGAVVSGLVRNILPEGWLNRIRRFLAEKNRAKRGNRGVARVSSLKDCRLDSDFG